jgi:phosphatidylglycerol---prolipoprotein diacylglyceryl transferase
MRRILFQRRGLTIYSYPTMLYVGLVAGIMAGNAAAHSVGLDAFRVFVATNLLILPALVGARLLYVASHWSIYRAHPHRVWDRNEGGATMYGALFLALLASVPVLNLLGLPFWIFWDVNVFTMLVTMIFGRIGCHLNGCCAGRASRIWAALYLSNHLGIWNKRIPTQLMEVGWAVVILIGAIHVWQAKPAPGVLFLVVVIAYACGRLVMESLRERETGEGEITLYHALSAVMILLASGVLTFH